MLVGTTIFPRKERHADQGAGKFEFSGMPDKVPELAQEQDIWLEGQLALAKTAKHAVIFQHIPWFVADPDEPRHEYFNIDLPIRHKMLEKFKNAGVKIVFCGHYHRNGGGTDGDLEVVVTSAIGAQLGSDKHGFRVVRVLDKCIKHQYYSLDQVPKEISFE
uniref:Calcineurin-like phosphoesterase domain-containing protein n=1 Tax=Strigamia maritima TaxID=126957 RepID=T1JHV3_STRMM